MTSGHGSHSGSVSSMTILAHHGCRTSTWNGDVWVHIEWGQRWILIQGTRFQMTARSWARWNSQRLGRRWSCRWRGWRCLETRRWFILFRRWRRCQIRMWWISMRSKMTTEGCRIKSWCNSGWLDQIGIRIWGPKWSWRHGRKSWDTWRMLSHEKRSMDSQIIKRARLKVTHGREWLEWLLHDVLRLPSRFVFIVGILFHVEGSKSLGLLYEWSLLTFRQVFPFGSKSFGDLRIVHFRIFQCNLTSLGSGPDHECVHGSLDMWGVHHKVIGWRRSAWWCRWSGVMAIVLLDHLLMRRMVGQMMIRSRRGHGMVGIQMEI